MGIDPLGRFLEPDPAAGRLGGQDIHPSTGFQQIAPGVLVPILPSEPRHWLLVGRTLHDLEMLELLR